MHFSYYYQYFLLHLMHTKKKFIGKTIHMVIYLLIHVLFCALNFVVPACRQSLGEAAHNHIMG